MYENRLGTDWTSLDHEEVLERAFALGVDAALGSVDREEYERLEAEAAGYDAYDRSLVELAYREGRTKALDRRRAGDSTASVWRELVEDEFDLADVTPSDPPGPTTQGPPKLIGRSSAMDRPTHTDLPSFLRK